MTTPAPEAALAVYPNPARGSFRVAIRLDQSGVGRLELFDVLGRRRAVIFEGPLAAGETGVDVPVGSLPAGVYFVRLRVGGLTATRPVTITP